MAGVAGGVGHGAVMLATALLATMTAQTSPPPAPAGSDVTVTARKLRKKPIRDAVGYFERHCFDASRLTGQPSSPRTDPDWHPLSPGDRAALGLTGNTARAFGTRLSDQQSAALTLTESTLRWGGRDLVEFRCTLIVVGGDQRGFADRVASIFRGPGTQKHIGERGGLPAVPGWQQQRWAAIPPIGSTDWQVFRTHGSGDSWVQVIAPAFYRSAEYVVGDLRTRKTGEPLTSLTLTYTRRLRREDGDIATAAASAPRAR